MNPGSVSKDMNRVSKGTEGAYTHLLDVMTASTNGFLKVVKNWFQEKTKRGGSSAMFGSKEDVIALSAAEKTLQTLADTLTHSHKPAYSPAVEAALKNVQTSVPGVTNPRDLPTPRR